MEIQEVDHMFLYDKQNYTMDANSTNASVHFTTNKLVLLRAVLIRLISLLNKLL